MSQTFRDRARRLTGLASLCVTAAVCVLGGAGCDNITCVFTTGCRPEPPGPQGSEPATLPRDGQWIVNGRPSVTSIVPEGDASSTTPVLVVFSESMSSTSLTGAVEIVGDTFGTPVQGVQQSLVGNGRVLVLLPSTPLDEGAYTVRLAAGAVATDLTGQTVFELDSDLGSFSVASTDPDEPRVVGSWPGDGDEDQSQTTEIVVAFDRRMSTLSVDGTTFDVKVDGSDPAIDPPASALQTSGGTLDPRVFLYQSVGPGGVLQPLGASASVEVRLAGITDTMGAPIDPVTIAFTTASFAAPVAVSLLSAPPDAIGAANLVAGTDELTVQVDLEGAQDGDQLSLVFVAEQRDGPMPQLAAFQRTIALPDAGTTQTGTFGLADLDFLDDDGAPRVDEGAVAFALRLRRGDVTSPLRVLDVDPAFPGIQDPVLDTVPPTIVELLVPGDGTTDALRSHQRDLVVVGRADEFVERVTVRSDAGDNGSPGELPPAVGSDESGLFVAAPVPGGVLAPGTVGYDVVVFDQALNPSDPIAGEFTQLGAVGAPGEGAFAPGESIRVEVFDAASLEPLAGATVLVHTDTGSGFPLEATASTDAAGGASLASAGAPAAGALVTVELAGYDLFTFFDVPAARLSIPLRRTGSGVTTSVSGNVSTGSEPARVAFESGLVDVKTSDTRRLTDAMNFRTADPVGPCVTVGTNCPFGTPIRPDRLGAQSLIAGRFDLAENEFAAALLVQAFDLVVPLAPAGALPTSSSFFVPFLLTETGLEPEELSEALETARLLATFTQGVDLGDLVGDPLTTGLPHVTVESIVPGVPGSLVVGLGLAFEASPGATDWTLRSAVPGAVTENGVFGVAGMLDTDFFLRAEIRDASGNRSGQRPRFSGLASLPAPGVLVPGDVPQLTAPAPGGSSGGASYNVVFTNSIPDALGQPGLYRVRLEDESGRGWDLWRTDPPDPGNQPTRVHVPALPTGTTGLADGAIDVTVSAWAWPSLDETLFLWSDVEREHDLFAHSAPVTFQQP